MNELDESPIDDGEDDGFDCSHECIDVDPEYLAVQSSDRLWLKAILPFVQLAAGGKMPIELPHDTRGRLKYASWEMTIAACERAARIFRSDLEPVDVFDDPDADDA